MITVRLLVLIVFGLFAGGTVFPCALPQTAKQTAKRHLDRALEFGMSTDFKRAEDEFNLAIKARDGHYPDAWESFAYYCLLPQLRFSEAVQALEKYIQQTPKDDHSEDLKTLAEVKQAANFQNLLKSSEKPDLTDIIKYAWLVRGYGDNHDEDALPYGEMAVRLYPVSSNAYVLLAQFLIHPSQKERKFEALSTALRLDPNNSKAHFELGNYHLWLSSEKDRLDLAVGEFHKALELSDGQLIVAWHRLGRAYTFLGQSKKAAAAFCNYLKAQKPGDLPEAVEKELKSTIQRLGGCPKNDE